jgi:hypothetical protein
MDTKTLIEDLDNQIMQLNNKICELDPIHDKVVFSFRHLLIMKRNWFVELIQRLEKWDWDIEDLVNNINSKIDVDTRKLLSNIS